MQPKALGYVNLQFQAGGCIVESSGVKRMFDATPDLAEYLTNPLKKPLGLSVTHSTENKKS